MIWEKTDYDDKYHHSIWFAQSSKSANDWIPPVEVRFSASTLEGLLSRRQEIINKKLKSFKIGVCA